MPALPAGWEEQADADGYAFFFNLVTGGTQWERPTADQAEPADAVAAAAAAAAAGAAAGAEGEGEAGDVADGGAGGGGDGGGEVVLPEGWVAVAAEDGSVYYWHDATQEASWEVPAA